MGWIDTIGYLVSKIPIERALFPDRDDVKALEKFVGTVAAPVAGREAPPAQNTAPATTQGPEGISQQGDIATACIPCSIGHYGTCSGLLNEAMRFAKKDGAGSEEVIDRVNMCLDELNSMERVDLRPEMVVSLSPWEKELANKALTGSRSLRHSLENLSNVDDLERVAATTQTTRNEIGREWFKQRLSNMSEGEKVAMTEKATLSLDEAKKLAAEEAAKGVEELWQSQEQ